MVTVYFFYGLAFLTMGAVIFLMPRKQDYFGLDRDIKFIGLFGLLHGLYEWTELLTLSGGSMSMHVIRVIRGALLPLSFIVLFVFGVRILVRYRPKLKIIFFLPIVCLITVLGVYIFSKDFTVTMIFSRYLIGAPGIFLTAAVLLSAFKKFKNTGLPLTVSIGIYVSGIFFIIYGVFSGLVTPEYGFFPASVFNNSNFMKLFGFPVQLVRMICAAMLALGFFMMTGVFNKGVSFMARKTTIKARLTLIISFSIFVTMTLGAILVYFSQANLLQASIGKEYLQISRLLSNYINETIDGEVEDAKSYATRSIWLNFLKEQNNKYQGMNSEAIKTYLLDTDKKWMGAKPDSPIIKECLENRVSVGMAEIVAVRKSIAELLATDKFGGLVAASGRSSDFYQADEEWWQKSYNDGKGNIFVGEAEHDESSGIWVIPIAIPFKDKAGAVIGICKYNISLNRLLAGIKTLSIGKTGRVALIDGEGRIIFYQNLPPMSRQLFSDEELIGIRANKKGYAFFNNPDPNGGKIFAAFSAVNPHYIVGRGVGWTMVILQDADETMASLYKFIVQLVGVAIVLLIVIIPVGSFFGNFLSVPIHELNVAAEHIMAGDWSYKLNVKTGDDLEGFTEAFKSMVNTVKNKQEELEDFSKNLERMVEDRTKELSHTQAATLNMLEDLAESKKELDKYSKKLEESLRIKTDFTSMVSHELRTPLAAIKEGISIVADGTAGSINKDQEGFLDIAKRNVDRLSRLINDILNFQKLEAGKMEFRFAEHDINEVVEEAGRMMTSAASGKGLEIKAELDEVLPRVKFDKDRIMEVLINLIDNAIKYTDKGEIIIRTSRGGENFIKVSVSDTGAGIKDTDIPRLFKQFEQLDQGSTRKTGSTGLGLAISKDIIKTHGGRIWAESTAAGAGATFSFVLPIAERRRSS
ncbi:MAG: ATP-binding protein [Candidatus Omnitrophica bacterium]|nr:ATP-binding protein [Candidatus Omnitrophota bacterium]